MVYVTYASMTDTEIALRATIGIFFVIAAFALWFKVMDKHEQDRRLSKREALEELLEKLAHGEEYDRTAHDKCQRYFLLCDILKII